MQLNMKIILIQCVLLAMQGMSYLLVQRTKHPVHDMERRVDHRIPLMPGFILVYVLWYPLIAVFPVALYHLSADGAVMYQNYMISILADIVISLLIYWFYPTGFIRPEIKGHRMSENLLRSMYVLDYKGLNCMPSMHCSMCFIILYYSFVCSDLGLWQYGFAAVSLLIVLSTVFTKQHVLIDVVTAIPLAGVCVLAGSIM